jgi:hypothetical protein
MQASGAAARGRLNWRPRLFVLKLTTYRLSSSNCSLSEGQKLSFDIEADRRSGKSAATNLQAV